MKHGFWENNPSDEHCLMLVITEIAEMVNADRKGIHAERYNYLRNEHSARSFESFVKDTVEDEFADIAIRLFDLAGAFGIDFDKTEPFQYYRAFDKFIITENAFELCKLLSRGGISIEVRVQFGLFYVKEWAKALNIDLYWHITQKMKYNESRPFRHGKKY